MNSIPVIGVPIVNGFHWLQRLVDSVDYPVDNFVVFNNNGRGELVEELDNLAKLPHQFIKKMTVCHLPSNMGVAGVFNLIIKSYVMAPYWIIANHDIAFVPGLLEEMVEVAKDPETGMIHPNAGDYEIGSYDLFLIKDWVVQNYGLFDENLYPAYCEDADYIMRVFNAPFKKISSLSKIHFHGNGPANEYYLHGGQTKKTSPELNERLDKINEMNFDYLTSKWGVGWRKVNPWKYPTNRVGVPISYTTYDLKFVRSKHLGF
jgi:GT2 family glycosyltransferase